ncbi:hypothetical protein JCM10207_000004 [Rhodosporidiobolus poonsookiae]
MASLSNFSFGAIERQLRPYAFEHLKRQLVLTRDYSLYIATSTSTRKSRFGKPARLDLFSSLPFELDSQLCLDFKPGDLFALSLVNQSLFFRLRTRTGHTAALWWHMIDQHFSKSGKPDAETPEQADARVKANINPIDLAFLIDVLEVSKKKGARCYGTTCFPRMWTKDQIQEIYSGHYFFLPEVLAQSALLDAVALSAGFAKKGLEEFTALRKERILAERAFLGRFW